MAAHRTRLGVLQVKRAALDLFQIELQGLCLHPGGECLVFLRGERESRLIRIRNARDGRSGIALCNFSHGAKTAAPVLPILSLRTFEQHLDANLELWLCAPAPRCLRCSAVWRWA